MHDIFGWGKKLFSVNFLVFLGLGFFALYLRCYQLENPGFWMDEAFGSYSALSGIHDEYPLFYVFQNISFFLFGVSDLSARIPSVFFSTLSVGLVGGISFLLFRKKELAFISILVYAFSYMDIAWARQARFYSFLEFFFLLEIFLTLLYFQNFSKKLLVGIVLLSCIGAWFHPLLFLFFPIFFFLLTYYLPKGRKKTIFQILLLISGIALIGARFLPDIATTFPAVFSLAPTKYIFSYAFSYFLYFLHEFGIFFLAFLGYAGYSLWKKQYASYIIGVLPVVLSIFMLSLYGFMFHHRYVFFVSPFIIIMSLGFLSEIREKISSPAARGIFLGILIFFGFFSYHSSIYPKTFYHLGPTAPQIDYRLAYEKIPENSAVISGIPSACMWYYSSKGECHSALYVDFVGNANAHEKILSQKVDPYTYVPYFQESDITSIPENSYLVLDGISEKGTLYPEILAELSKNAELIYEENAEYNFVKVYKLKKTSP